MKLRHQMMLMCLTALVVLVAAGKDYYKVLGVKKKATNRQLKKAYRKLALENHPDKVAEDQKEQAKKRFIDISEAYDVLSDPEKRRNYDQFGSADGAAGGAGFGGGGGGFHSGFNMDPFEMFNDFFGGGGGGGGHQEFKFGGGGNSGGFGGFGGFGDFGAGAGGFGGGAGGFGGQKPLTRLYEKDSNVRTLSKNKFPRSKKANNEWLVQFYSLSNQASIKLKDTVESIANDLKNKVKVGAINCDKNKVFCLQMGVHKYPAFKYYWAGEATDYEGDLTDEYEIYNFAISKHLKRLQELRDRGEPEKLHKSSQKKLCNVGSDASNKVSVTCAIFVLSSNPAKRKREMEAVIALNKKFRKFRGVQLSWTDKQTQALKKLKVSPSSSVPALVILKLKRGKLRGAVFSSKFTVEELSKTFDRLQGGDLTLNPLKDLRIDFR